MDIIPDLLASALVPKASSTGNNKKQKNKHYENQSSTKSDNSLDADDMNETKAKLVEKSSNWTEKDRRSTNDRRKQIAKRGRWLESRDTKDRRKSDSVISITV